MRIVNIFFLFSCFQLHASNIDSLFQKANSHYQAEQYQEALSFYNEVLNTDTHSLERYLNLGNSHYQNGNIPASILHFERALLLQPLHKEAQHNLSIAQLRIEMADELPILFFEQWWKSFILLTTPNNWSILLIISLWLSAILIIRFTNSKSRGLFKLLIALLMLCIVSGAAYHKNSKEQEKTFAILFTDENIKSESTENSQTLQVVSAGNKIEVLQIENDWALIQLTNGNQGWVRNTSFLEI